MKTWSFADIKSFILSNNFAISCPSCKKSVDCKPVLIFYPEYNDINDITDILVDVGLRVDNPEDVCDAIKQGVGTRRVELQEALRAAFVGSDAEDAASLSYAGDALN